MRSLLAILAILAVGAAATAAWATAPGKNGRLVYRGYLDAGRTTGALFTVNPDGTALKRVTRPRHGVIDQEADWAPNGAKIAFERKVPCPAGGSKNGLDNTCDRIYTMKSDGKAPRSLVACGFKANAPFPGNCVGVNTPAWSPDGSKIAFRYSLVDEDYDDSLDVDAGIWIVNANGTDLRQVTQRTPGNSWDLGPQWSPDGGKLVFYRHDFERDADAVLTANVDGSGVFRVTPWELGAGDGPDWSPDGKWLLFRAEPKDGSSNIYKVHPDGTGLTNLTKQSPRGFHYLSSTFSPDGAKITTSRTPGAGRAGAADVFVMNADGSNIRPVKKTRLWESSVDWGPR